MNYLALDLEMNQPSNRIIEVGITEGDISLDSSTWKKHSWFIDPGEPISPFIQDLCNITDEMIKENTSTHKEVFEYLMDMKNVGFEIVTWGEGDWRLLGQEFWMHNLNPRDLPFGRRHFDVKTIHNFYKMARGQNIKGGLKSALGYWHLKFDGSSHRADDDAFNTLLLLQKIMNHHKGMLDLVNQAKEL